MLAARFEFLASDRGRYVLVDGEIERLVPGLRSGGNGSTWRNASGLLAGSKHSLQKCRELVGDPVSKSLLGQI